MDAPASTVTSGFSAAGNDNLLLSGPLVVMAALIWLIDRKHRAGTEAIVSDVYSGMLRQLMPEVVGLAACFVLVATLLMIGKDLGAPSRDTFDEQAWEGIIREWPLLMTADTLLSMQAMLRVVLFLSAALRTVGAAASPLAGESAAFFLLAAVSRVVLLALSPMDVYHCNGPMGGWVHVALEVMVLPLLYRCTRLHEVRAFPVLVGSIFAMWGAQSNHFAIGEQAAYLDVLFSLGHLLELLAAGAFLWRTMMVGSGRQAAPFATFAHVLLPVQQFFPMYFLLCAFARPFEAPPELVGAGWPFQVLQAAAFVQVGMYIFAGTLHMAWDDKDYKQLDLQTELLIAV